MRDINGLRVVWILGDSLWYLWIMRGVCLYEVIFIVVFLGWFDRIELIERSERLEENIV